MLVRRVRRRRFGIVSLSVQWRDRRAAPRLCRSEVGRVQRHDRVAARLDARQVHGGHRQGAGHVETSGGEFRLVKLRVRRALGQCFQRGFCHHAPHQAQAGVAKEVHEIIRARQRIVGVLHAFLHEIHARRLQILGRGLQRGDEFFHPLGFGVVLAEAFHQIEEGHDVLAAVLCQLAANEVERLDAIGALVDHRDPRVAGELGHAPFLDVAMPAVDLLRLHGHVETLVGEKTLDHRGEQRHKTVGLLVLGAMRGVDQG
mmetsp:Transcript_3454/g.6118  ORF Transcript_3454/g.6118 Transcript_3454/m.6118 type:complete len:258 (-) Transcript_3454:107-880(-)